MSRRPAPSAALLLLAMLLPAGARGQAPAQGAAPERVPTPGGAVVHPTPVDRRIHDAVHYAAVRIAGDLVSLSGVVVGPQPGDSATAEAFEAQVRRAFRSIERSLRAAGVGFDDVVALRTYHVWRSPRVPGGKQQQFAIFSRVKDEFLRPPYSTWTAVGVTELLPDQGIVEIEVLARLPRPASP